MIIFLTTIFFIFGLIIGSFLNVVIFRLNTQRTFGGRSMCMSCQKQLSWYELIPLFSFLFLRGRCSNCKTKISYQYPLVEFLCGLIFVSIFWKFQDAFFSSTLGFSLSFAYYAVSFALLLVIAVYDYRHKIIPDSLALILGILSFVGLFLFSSDGFSNFYPHLPSVVELLSPLFIALPFALLWLVSSGRWMGLGDAKLAVGLTWLVGFTRALSGVVVAFWFGALVGLLLIVFSKKYGMKSEIPFAPYLILGIFLAFIFELHLFGI
jgi:leader peptidase (prepilin peptidase)/N-methyltransferase